MRELEFSKIFCKIELKDAMKERIINSCVNGGRSLQYIKWAKGITVIACSLLFLFGVNTYSTIAYGVNLVSEFYTFIQDTNRNMVVVNDPERYRNAPDLKADITKENTNTDIYSFLKEHEMTDLFVPKSLSKDWILADSDFRYYGVIATNQPSDLKPSLGFQVSNGVDQIYATIMNGSYGQPTAYQVGVDYAETQTVNGIEFLIVHIKEDLTYEEYLSDLDAEFDQIFAGSSIDFHQESTTYKELASEEHYKFFSGFGAIIDFSARGYTYSYCLTKGIVPMEFIEDLN